MNGTTWQDFVDSLREAGSYRDRVKPQRLEKDINTYTGHGSKKAQEGSPFKKLKVSFKGKGFNDISAPLEEEVEAESFDAQEVLEPRIWEQEALKPLISNKLIKIAQDFIDNLPIEVDVEDIRLTGSLANYNWSTYSDIDLHIIVDFAGVDENRVLVKSFFDNARMRWNNKHDIKMKGYDVEIYVEDSREQHLSSGIYSLLDEEWIKKPQRFRNSIDFFSARKKADDMETQANMVSNLVNAGKLKEALKAIERIKNKIKKMRSAGLESAMREFSIENIAFKILRRNDILQLLNTLRDTAYDRLMTVKEE
jgi:predicted nucleotidyltransferase